MRKLICDKCGKEIIQGENYTKIAINGHTNSVKAHEQKTGCIGGSVSSTIREQKQDAQYVGISVKEFCMNCTEKIIACINEN